MLIYQRVTMDFPLSQWFFFGTPPRMHCRITSFPRKATLVQARSWIFIGGRMVIDLTSGISDSQY